MFTKPESKPIDTISPVEIAEVIDQLAAKIRADGNADLLGPWAISRLASKLGIAVAVSVSDVAIKGWTGTSCASSGRQRAEVLEVKRRRGAGNRNS